MSWTWSDAWVLTATYACVTAQNPAGLADIVAAGDHINHSIFTDEEFEHAFTRLTAAGLVEVVPGNKILVTDAGLQLCKEAVDPVREALRATDNVDRALRAIELGEVIPVEIPPAVLDAARQRYLEGHAV